MAHLAVASAVGFRTRPAELAAAVLAVPGFSLRRVESEGRRLRGDPLTLITDGLRSDDREVMFDFMGRNREEWGFLWATKTSAGLVGEPDILVLNWPGRPDDAMVGGFAALCDASAAELGYLDEKDPFPGFRILRDIPRGLPGLAWAMWFGPQLASFLPPGAVERCWPVAEHRPAGHLVMLDRAPPPYPATAREAVAACLGADVFAPRKTPWPLDTSAKNTITPDWVTKGVPPELPPGMRIIGYMPKKDNESK